MAVNSIGVHLFSNLRGQPGSFANDVERIIRPGVPDAAFRSMGKRGQPFTLVSVRDVADITEGRTLFTQYLAQLDADPVALIWNDYDFASLDTLLVMPIAISLQLLQARARFVGNLIGTNSQAWLEVRWELVFTQV